jgi:hypothetical protein
MNPTSDTQVICNLGTESTKIEDSSQLSATKKINQARENEELEISPRSYDHWGYNIELDPDGLDDKYDYSADIAKVEADHKSEISTQTVIVVAGEISSLSSDIPIWRLSSLSHHYPKISCEVVKKVIEGLESIMELYHIYGLTRVEDRKFKHLERVIYKKKLDKIKVTAATRMLNFITTNGEKEWMNYFKYKTLAFYAHYETEKTDLLPTLSGLDKDYPGVIFGGFVSQFVKLMQKKDKELFSSFIVAINNSKMGLPRPTDDMIEAAEDKCVNHLTDPRHLDRVEPEDKTLKDLGLIGEEVVLNKINLMRQLKRTVEEMFEDVVFTEEIQFEPFYPSTSANYNKSRGKAGAVGEVYDQCSIGTDPEGSFLIEMRKINSLLSREQTALYGDVSKLDQIRLDEDSRIETSSPAIEYNLTNLRIRWKELYLKIYDKAQTEHPIVKAVGLAEALKVRVISKGPPMLYTALKPLQKFMWSTLKKNSVFQLIGTPVLEEHINKLFGEMNDDDMIVNGDYKASTDNLHSWVSNYLAECFVDIINDNGIKSGKPFFMITDCHRRMLLTSLTGHLFEMRDGSLKRQTEGQLMGSITSFPFLCLANAAMCRWALELSNMTPYRLRDRVLKAGCKTIIAPLKVNGDDCTMKGKRSNIRSLWEDITSFGGLTSSQGKTLFSLPHKPICVINSQTYDYDVLTKSWINRKYVNLGILLGKSRSTVAGTSSSDNVPYSALGALHRELYKSTHSRLWDEVSRRFIYYNSKTLKQCPHIPWDAPEYLGGPGLVPIQGEMRLRDRACASYIISNVNSKKKYEKIISTRMQCDWKLHQVVKKRLETYGIEPKPFMDIRRDDIIFDPMNTLIDDFIVGEDTESNYSRLYKYLTIETLFTKQLSQVYDPDELNWNNKVCRHNDIVWANAEERHWNCLGLKIRQTHEIMYEKKFMVVPCMESITETTLEVA